MFQDELLAYKNQSENIYLKAIITKMLFLKILVSKLKLLMLQHGNDHSSTRPALTWLPGPLFSTLLTLTVQARHAQHFRTHTAQYGVVPFTVWVCK